MISESLPTGRVQYILRLNPRFRFALFGAFSALFVTGVAWLVADGLKDTSSGELWQVIAANLLMLHGGAAMVTLLLLGALVPLHVMRSWRRRTNRVTGSTMVTFNAVLIVTSFGLYYFGSEALRPWMSTVHTGFGIALPVLFIVHVVLGRRSSRRNRSNV